MLGGKVIKRKEKEKVGNDEQGQRRQESEAGEVLELSAPSGVKPEWFKPCLILF